MLAAGALLQLSSTIRWRIMLNYVGYPLSFFKSLGYYLIGFGISFVTPLAQLGGRPAKAFLLAKTEKIPLREGMVSVLLEIFLEMSADFLVVATLLPFVLLYIGFPRRIEFGLIASFLFLAGLLIFLHREFRNGRAVVTRLLRFFKLNRLLETHGLMQAVEDGEKLFMAYFHRKNKGGLAGIIASLVISITFFFEIASIFYVFGIPITFTNVFLARLFIYIAYILPIPGALGISEWLQAFYFSTILNLSSGVGVAFSLTYKAIDFSYSLLGIAYLLIVLARHSLLPNLKRSLAIIKKTAAKLNHKPTK